MAINKEKKEAILESAEKALAKAASLAFVGFKGLSANDTNVLRKELRKEGVSYRVVKKTLLRRVLPSTGAKGEAPDLPGEIAVAYGDDPIAPSRSIYGFEKKYAGLVSLAGGIFEGEYRSRESMLQIATIPPLPVLRGQFLNLINSPLQGLVIALEQLRSKKVG